MQAHSWIIPDSELKIIIIISRVTGENQGST